MDKKLILLVDDDPDVRLSLRLPLEATGYAISEAANPKEGLTAIKNSKPDLIILDVMMDSATAGFQFALDLHSEDPKSELKEYKEIPILMLTAIHGTTPLRFSPDQDYLPVQKFLEKPVEPEVLIASVKELLGE
ncbi:MAG: response regulator [Anaerolineales bacterium]|nr:response regulator [Anaerolineales bacterium]